MRNSPITKIPTPLGASKGTSASPTAADLGDANLPSRGGMSLQSWVVLGTIAVGSTYFLWGGLKHLAARSRVATDDGDATNRPTFGAAGPRCGEAPGRGRAESKNQLCGQFAVGDASHTIGPE